VKLEKKLLRLASSIAICQLAGVVGSISTISAIPTWYAVLEKPFFAPPNWLFAPIWITLYFLMGVSLYIVWNIWISRGPVRTAIYLFGIQLVLNALWPALFFGLESPFLGLIEIAILWVAIALTVFRFYRISKQAALLLLPYISWVTVALMLNLSIWILNP
jgi:benzodiazapine receptor